MMMPRCTAAVFISVLLAGTAAAQTGAANATSGSETSQTSGASSQSLTPEDHAFLNYAAQDNQAEIQLCLVAEKVAPAGAVKAFARLMVNDHVQIENHLAILANDLNLELPNGLGKDGQETMSRLKDLHGATFDRSFMEAQVSDHSSDLKKYDDEIKATKNDGIRSYAAETVSVLKQHLDLARAVLDAIKGQSSSSSMR